MCIGTPDHWHAILAAATMKTGKDVYVEKPLRRTVPEGRRVVETAATYGRILQTGLQRRSLGVYRHVCELVRNGRIGRLLQVQVGIIGINHGVQAGRDFPAACVPDGFGYDLWLGPAPVTPFCPQRVARGNEVYATGTTSRTTRQASSVATASTLWTSPNGVSAVTSSLGRYTPSQPMSLWVA